MADPFDGDWDPGAYWSTATLGESVPGVLTPLNWSLWKRGGEAGLRSALVAVGALDRRRAKVPRRDSERLTGVFHGRLATSVDHLGGLRVAVSSPLAAASAVKAVQRLDEATRPWWSSHVRRAARLNRDDAREVWLLAADRFAVAISAHLTSMFAAVQPAHDAVFRLCAAVDKPELVGPLTCGCATQAEVKVVEDLWAVSRDRLGLDAFLAEHGYHGHDEGEIASRVWREDAGTVEHLVAEYREQDESPDGALRVRSLERSIAERDLLDALPRWQQAGARGLLRVAARTIPLRGLGKSAVLRAIDVARAAARRNGELMVAAGYLDDPDDVFLLTAEEMRTDVKRHRLVEERRAQRAEHLATTLPTGWHGRPTPSPVSASTVLTGTTLDGIGVSAGVAEARARVVLGAADLVVEPGEILVTPHADPSWGPLMFSAAGVVADIGGEFSHAAVVARELGVPCVMGTGDGTRRLRTGDLLRIDGRTGIVEVLGVSPGI